MKHSNIRLCLSLLALLLASAGTFAEQHTMQFPEDGVRMRDLHGTAPVRVCDPGSRWIRVGFESLQLRGDDRLGLTSSSGDRLRFEGTRWNNRSFYARALRGDCITFSATFSSTESRYRLSGYQAG